MEGAAQGHERGGGASLLAPSAVAYCSWQKITSEWMTADLRTPSARKTRSRAVEPCSEAVGSGSPIKKNPATAIFV